MGEPASLERHREVAVALFGDPQVAEWIWPGARGGPRTPAQAEEILGRFADHWDRHGFGWWFLRERDGGELVGESGLQWTEVDGRLQVEVGWTVAPSRWRRGYATEAARAAVAHGFEVLDLDEIVAFTLPDNAASRRVMEKLGMEEVGPIEHAGLPHVLYRLKRRGG